MIALVGDYDPAVTAHAAIDRCVEVSGVDAQWLATSALTDVASSTGIWCVPASPYADTAAVLRAIRFAREHSVPFLGTCGGYQHALVEYARNELGIAGAAHAELDASAELLLVSPLSCSMVEVAEEIELDAASRLAGICGATTLREEYHCNFGLNEQHRSVLAGGALRIVATGARGEARAFELESHPFYFGTAFQPERRVLRTGTVHPLVQAFFEAC